MGILQEEEGLFPPCLRCRSGWGAWEQVPLEEEEWERVEYHRRSS